ncbi:SusD/RagB family nutrient-binding outer membrane lipoprotein [Flavihumibacter profundi]|uniref:SusD/RagB family nutrient-binding outer membrane lipoprotein n=1 Tax=Flavihumibacter profundi TaxID=2716883 RepID=UPI001CC33ED5|nr:SusD/RagB family nutrient-binding outer membrane lipoprotein [Flavihumibacter profundi]MBZ5859406.1 SusD/RagB family nutrient-binding outer membrane lipoprotein [Flavihumibacter profundi]
MKYSNNSLIKTVLILALLIQLSCTKETFTRTNINPNSPATVTPGNILPVVETSLAYTEGGDFARFANLFVQQSVGFSRQSEAYYHYILTSTDFDTPWGNLYTSVLGNNKDMMLKADAGGYNVYGGISRILMAYTLQVLADMWGDVPYSEALTGATNTHPRYDNAKALYDTIQNLIDVAISKLTDPDKGGLRPGTDDIIYGGNADLWVKFGHAIKARLFIHQSKGNPDMANKALDEANQAFASKDDNAQFVFGMAETFANPIYEFNEQRGDIDYGAGTLVNKLIALKDPRLNIFTDTSYNDVNGAGIGSYYGDINGHVEFITYDEMLFVKAEATLWSSGNIAQSQTFYQEAIKANMEKLGVAPADITTYLAANGTLPSNATDAIAQVALQEWIALYQNPEAWTTWRRTGSPILTPTAGSLGVPRRFLYPTNEYSLNGKNVPQATLYTPNIFWDF